MSPARLGRVALLLALIAGVAVAAAYREQFDPTALYITMLPGAIAYTYLGYAGREAVAGGEALIQKGLLALGLLALLLFVPRLVTLLRRRSSKASDATEPRIGDIR
jgi:hypothetical protein